MADVKFIKNHPPYIIGEVASFSDELAARLMTRGLAAPNGAPAPTAVQAPATQEKPKEEKTPAKKA